MKPKHEIVNSFYLYAALLSPDGQRQIEEKVKGIAQKTLNLSEIKDNTHSFTSIEEQKNFEVFIKQVDKSKVAVQKALDEAQLLFDSLIQRFRIKKENIMKYSAEVLSDEKLLHLFSIEDIF